MTTDRIHKEISIRAPRERVWACLTDPDLLAAWLMRNDFRPRTGHDFAFNTAPSGEFDGRVECTVLEVSEPHRLVLSWRANTVPADTRVTFELERSGEGTLLRLTHEGFAALGDAAEHQARSHSDGWDDHLWMLQRQAEEDTRGGQQEPGAPDWTRFRLHVAIDVEPAQALDAWRSARGWQSFFVETLQISDPDGHARPLEAAARAGDHYSGRWHNGRRLSGRFLEVNDDSVRFSFGDGEVRVSARTHGEGCLVILEQSGIPDDETSRMHVHANCRGGWVYFLTLLKVLLEHGIDARDTTRATGASFSTYFDPAALPPAPEDHARSVAQ